MCSLHLPVQYSLMNTVIYFESFLETAETSSCAMNVVNNLDVLDIDKTDCLSVTFDLSGIECGMGQGIILCFSGSKMVVLLSAV